MRASPIIHLNGFPGTGKLTIARELIDLLNSRLGTLGGEGEQALDASKLVHNHLLIDPADAILHRTQPGYQSLRKALREVIFTALVDEKATHGTTYVFTDWQSGDSTGTQVCKEFITMSKNRGCEYIPVIITCDEDENCRRLIDGQREQWSKVRNVDLLLQWRQRKDPPPVYEFRDLERRLEVDVTKLSAKQAAEAIFKHVSPYLS
ncbi:uncharacterized protein RCC_09573 [Ramularia collo-cygni]|uniref:Uncharacterized protein n=1 Tax=Ramularia collo-cygni TaxID=112498 RepID=A0A2D3VPI4_9PEZI|nr:uncharacterized protein RCC_09573 [Ramularia collo-cygni]CZT23858.1 uncharacterized protein RCC_09573 [Ramularia collo-cygni]